MNKAILMGRLTKDPDVRYTNDGMAIARYTLAIDRRNDGADFIPCVTFKKGAEFAEKYLKKGMKIAVCGSIQTGSYTNKDGQKVYTTEVIVNEHEFAESKQTTQKAPEQKDHYDGFMSIPEGMDEEELPFA